MTFFNRKRDKSFNRDRRKSKDSKYAFYILLSFEMLFSMVSFVAFAVKIDVFFPKLLHKFK